MLFKPPRLIHFHGSPRKLMYLPYEILPMTQSITFYFCFLLYPVYVSGSPLLPLYSLFCHTCPPVFTLPNWTAAPIFSSEIVPCSLRASACFPSTWMPSHYFTDFRENGSVLQFLLVTVYSPTSTCLSPHLDQPTRAFPCLHAACQEQSSSFSPIQIRMLLKTLILFNSLSVCAHSASFSPTALIVLHKILLFSIKTKWTSPRLSEERKWAGGKEHPVPWVTGLWKLRYPWIAISAVRLAFSLKFLKIHH